MLLQLATLAAAAATSPPFKTAVGLRPAARGLQDFAECPVLTKIKKDDSYERREIELWFARGKTTSPKTNEELANAFLVPNRHLKAMCQQFLDEVREVEEASG